MTSDDVQAMLGGLFPSGMGRPPGVEGPVLPNGDFYSQPQTPDYSKLFRAAIGIGNAGRDIGEGRVGLVQGKISEKIAKAEAGRIEARGRRLKSTATAIAGAQGSAEGLPLLSELSILQAAHQDATTRLYQGNIEKFAAEQKAKRAFYKAPADLLDSLIDPKTGKSLFTEKA